MYERKPLSNKKRFDVLKRDGFKCQYCGRSAPDVVLEVDHIIPVSDGGTNDMDNLITACYECNHGKFKYRLDDEEACSVQKASIVELNKRANQMEMLFAMREDSVRKRKKIADETIIEVEKYLGIRLSDSQAGRVRSYLEEYGPDYVLDSAYTVSVKFRDHIYGSVDNAIKAIGHSCYKSRREDTRNTVRLCVLASRDYLEELREKYGIEISNNMDISDIVCPVETAFVESMWLQEGERLEEERHRN